MKAIKFFIFSFLLCTNYLLVYAQQFPGNVASPTHWIQVIPNGNDYKIHDLISSNQTSFFQENLTYKLWNNHPSIILDERNKLSFELGHLDLSKCTWFCAYYPTNANEENIIWCSSDINGKFIIQTNKRMADLSTFQYMNYTDLVLEQPKVSVFVNNSGDSARYFNQVMVGKQPDSFHLPVHSFKGRFAELIIYDKVLNNTEQLKVASYLCLKYGITLTDHSANYLNSKSKSVWNGIDYSDYHHNIAGIATDSSSSLKQLMSSSSNNQQLLTIAAIDSLEDESYFIWGDNNARMTLADKQQGQPQMIERDFMGVYSSSKDSIKTKLTFNFNATDLPQQTNTKYWLAVDYSAKSEYHNINTEFLPLVRSGISNDYNTDIVWTKTQKGRMNFSIAKSDDYLLIAESILPSCKYQTLGGLRIKIIGADFPVKISLINQLNGYTMIKQLLQSNDVINFSGLREGSYMISCIDALGKLKSEKYHLSSEDGPSFSSQLLQSYTMPPSGILSIDASEGMSSGMSYQWSNENGFLAATPQIDIKTPGSYTLKIEKAGCACYKDITVSKAIIKSINNVLLYPNPTTDGNYNAQVSLDAISNMELYVYKADGKLIEKKFFSGKQLYMISGKINHSGIYFLKFKVGLSECT